MFKLAIKIPERRSHVFIANIGHILHLFHTVETVNCEQINVYWVPPNQFINFEISLAATDRLTQILIK